MQKILLAQPVTAPMLLQLQTLVGDKAQLEAVTSTSDEEFALLAADAHVLMNGFRKMDGKTLALAPKVRFIQQLGVGYNNFDINAISQAGIIASNCPGVNSQAVAEHTIMLMMVLLKRFVEAERATRANIWAQMSLVEAGLGEIGAATIGLVGFGSIGQAVAERLKPFGSRLLYTAQHQAAAALEERFGVSYVTLPDLLASATIVSLHLPLTSQTKQLIGEKELRQMKPGALLINTSRGDIVDENALRQAFESGHLAGAGLDVLAQERDGANPFTDLPQVVVTPHLAGTTQATLARTIKMAFENVLRFMQGEEPLYILPELKTVKPAL
jgi:phosphoglycerate dehydrogenase-like enzyme